MDIPFENVIITLIQCTSLLGIKHGFLKDKHPLEDLAVM